MEPDNRHQPDLQTSFDYASANLRSETFHRSLRSLGFSLLVISLPAAFPFFPVLYDYGALLIIGGWIGSLIYFVRAAILLMRNMEAYSASMGVFLPLFILTLTLGTQIWLGIEIYRTYSPWMPGIEEAHPEHSPQ